MNSKSKILSLYLAKTSALISQGDFSTASLEILLERIDDALKEENVEDVRDVLKKYIPKYSKDFSYG